MASSKKRRKWASLDRKQAAGPSPRPSRDGDRRRRPLTDQIREVLKAKRKARDWTIDDAPIDLPTDAEGGSGPLDDPASRPLP